MFRVLPGTHLYQKKPVVSRRVSILSRRQVFVSGYALPILYLDPFRHRISIFFCGGHHLFNFFPISPWFFCSFSNLETCPTKTHKKFWGSQTPLPKYYQCQMPPQTHQAAAEPWDRLVPVGAQQANEQILHWRFRLGEKNTTFFFLFSSTSCGLSVWMKVGSKRNTV